MNGFTEYMKRYRFGKWLMESNLALAIMIAISVGALFVFAGFSAGRKYATSKATVNELATVSPVTSSTKTATLAVTTTAPQTLGKATQVTTGDEEVGWKPVVTGSYRYSEKTGTNDLQFYQMAGQKYSIRSALVSSDANRIEAFWATEVFIVGRTLSPGNLPIWVVTKFRHTNK